MSQIIRSENASNSAGRKIRLHGHVVTREELHVYVLNLLNEGVTGTKALSLRIGKKERQTKRILDEMALKKLVSQDPMTGRIIKTQKQEYVEFQENLFRKDTFRQIPEIRKFILKCQSRGVRNKTISGYLSNLKAIFTSMKTHPASVITSRYNAEEFFANYVILCRTMYPTKNGAPQMHRVSYRVFLDSVANISYGHGMAKGAGFGSHHEAFQKYKGAHIPLDVCRDLSDMMLQDKNYLVHVFFNIGIMTGARSGAISTMTWDRINLTKEDFRLDQFETKDDSAGHVHLGKLGEWKHKYPPPELCEILLQWKNKHAPENSRFVFIPDGENDITNRNRCMNVRLEVIPQLKSYLEKFRHRLSSITQEYVFVAGEAGHLNRHTFAQLLRNKGLSNSEIAFAGGWKSDQTVDWYAEISEEEKARSREALAGMFSK